MYGTRLVTAQTGTAGGCCSALRKPKCKQLKLKHTAQMWPEANSFQGIVTLPVCMTGTAHNEPKQWKTQSNNIYENELFSCFTPSRQVVSKVNQSLFAVSASRGCREVRKVSDSKPHVSRNAPLVM